MKLQHRAKRVEITQSAAKAARPATSSGFGPQASLALPAAAAPVASHRILPPMLTRIEAGFIVELVPEKKRVLMQLLQSKPKQLQLILCTLVT